jgi:hypothetical protein
VQWELNRVPISGATNLIYSNPWVRRADMGLLSLIASNRAGIVTQAVSFVTGTLHDGVTGMFDPSFPFDDMPITAVQVLESDMQGRLLVGGRRSPKAHGPSMDLVRADDSGTVDASFRFSSEAPVTQFFDILPLSSGSVVLSASTLPTMGSTQFVVMWINGAGETMKTRTLAGGPAYRLAVDSGGSVLAGGAFVAVDGEPRSRVARFTADGELSGDLGTGAVVDGAVWALAEAPDGGVWIGGDFTTIDAVSRHRIARLTTTGGLNPSFDPLDGFDGRVVDLIQATSDTGWVAGRFRFYRTERHPDIVGLQADGVARPITAVAGANRFRKDPQGRIWVGGTATQRLLVDGSPDAQSRLPGAAGGSSCSLITVTPGGSVVATGVASPGLSWPSSLARLLVEDEVGSVAPAMLGDPFGPFLRPDGFPLAPTVSGHQLAFSWYLGTNLMFQRVDIPHIFWSTGTDFSQTLRVVVSNPSGSVTSAPIFVQTNAPAAFNFLGPPADTLAFVGETVVLACRKGANEQPADAEVQWYRDSQPVPSNRGILVIPAAAASDSGCYTCQMRRDFSFAGGATILRVVAPVDFNAALDTNGLKFSVSAPESWHVSSVDPAVAGSYVAAGPIPARTSTFFEVPLFGSGKLRFRWRLRSLSGGGSLRCDVGGYALAQLSASSDWVETEVAVNNSSQFFPLAARWTYTQGDGDGSDSDQAAVDWIRFTQPRIPAPQLRLNPASLQVAEGQPFQLVAVVDGPPLRSISGFGTTFQLRVPRARSSNRAGRLSRMRELTTSL